MVMNELMSRINRIFEGLMSCSIEFHPAHTLTREQWGVEDLERLKGEKASMPQYIQAYEPSTFGFPVHLHGAFAGLAVVHRVSRVEPAKLMQLAELLTMVLEHGVRNEERRERLRLIEERLSLLQETSNVIPLRPARFGRVLQVIDTESTPPAQSSPLTEMPLLIETKPGFPLHRVAVEIHHLSRRWAFVSMEDLPGEIFNSRESLQQLGSVTLFIRDIALLTTEQQLRLGEYLAIKPSSDMPHVIAGSMCSPAELEAQGRVFGHLLKQFCISHLQWTEKTPEQVTNELINASLRHILEQTRETHKHGEHFIPFNVQFFNPDPPFVH